jgi:hypothetical protein
MGGSSVNASHGNIILRGFTLVTFLAKVLRLSLAWRSGDHGDPAHLKGSDKA